MKKTVIIIVNVLIILALLTFVVLYSHYTSRNTTQRQIEHFENTTITMEHVTENYLEGEQRICDVWARYINSKDMTIEEAVPFIRISHVLPNASAHIVYEDTLSGLSTRAGNDDSGDYTVSYARTGLLNDVSWIHEIGAELEQKWVFPQEEFENAELSMIDADGDYIIKGHSFKNSSFFEFYRSYNTADPSSAQELFEKSLRRPALYHAQFPRRGMHSRLYPGCRGRGMDVSQLHADEGSECKYRKLAADRFCFRRPPDPVRI